MIDSDFGRMDVAIEIPLCPRKITLAHLLWGCQKMRERERERETEGSCDREELYLGALEEKIKLKFRVRGQP